MYFMYVDESGDPGMLVSPTRYFVLSGLVVHESYWLQCLEQLVEFRRRMQRTFGLLLSEEIHSAAMISRPGLLVRIPRHDRLTIMRFFADELAQMQYLNVINVVVDKAGKSVDFDPLIVGWRALIQRFSNTMSHRNFPGGTQSNENGMIFPDVTDTRRVTQLVRQLRRYNPVPNQPQFGLGYRNMTLTNIIEDPNYRDSNHSYFIQGADLAAYLLYQKLAPNAYIQRKSAHRYFDRLGPILCRVAATGDPQGIIRL